MKQNTYNNNRAIINIRAKSFDWEIVLRGKYRGIRLLKNLLEPIQYKRIAVNIEKAALLISE